MRATALTEVYRAAPVYDLARRAEHRDALTATLYALADLGVAVLPVRTDGQGQKHPNDKRTAAERADDDARLFAERGIDPGSDDAATAATGGVYCGTTDPVRLAAYLARYHPAPDALRFAAWTGRSRLAVVDADDPDQVAALRRFGISDPPTVTTPGDPERMHHGGGHWVYVLPDDLDVTAYAGGMFTIKVPDGPDGAVGRFDVKIGGSYVLLPGSTRSAGSYVATGTVRVLDGPLLGRVREHVAARIDADRRGRERAAGTGTPSTPRTSASGEHSAPAGDPDADDHPFAVTDHPAVRAAVTAWADETPRENPHDWLFGRGAKLASAHVLGCITAATFREGDHTAAVRFGELVADRTTNRGEDWESEARRTLDAGMSKGYKKTRAEQQQEWNMPDLGFGDPVTNGNGEHTTADTGRPVGEFERMTAQEYWKLKARNAARERFDAEQRAAHPEDPLPTFTTLRELLAEPDEDDEYRIEKLHLAGGCRSLIVAASKTGKTTLMHDVIASAVDGTPALGAFAVHRPFEHVALVDLELSRTVTRRWLRRRNVANVDAVHLVNMCGREGMIDLTDDRDRSRWARQLADMGTDLLVLDCFEPLLAAAGLELSNQARPLLSAIDALLVKSGVADLALVHHMGHEGIRAKGDSALLGWPDLLLNYTLADLDGEAARFLATTGRVDEPLAPGRVLLDVDTGRLTYTGDAPAAAKADRATERAIPLVLEVLCEAAVTATRDRNPAAARVLTGTITDTVGGNRKVVRDALDLAHARKLVARHFPGGRAIEWEITERGCDVWTNTAATPPETGEGRTTRATPENTS